MSRRNSENAEKELEHIQNTDGNESEGPGPPEPPGPSADQGQEESKIDQVIDQWTRGLTDDIEEVFEALLEADKRDADDRRKKTKEAVEDWTVSKICDGLKNGRFKNIVVFTGAGISTSAGIPGTSIIILLIWFTKDSLNWSKPLTFCLKGVYGP